MPAPAPMPSADPMALPASSPLPAFGGGANVQFFDGPSSSNVPLTGLVDMFAGGSIFPQASGAPWFTCADGDDFVMNSSAAVNMGGIIGYTQQ